MWYMFGSVKANDCLFTTEKVIIIMWNHMIGTGSMRVDTRNNKESICYAFS